MERGCVSQRPPPARSPGGLSFHNNQIEKDPAARADRAASAIFKMRKACVLFRTLNKVFIAKRCRLVREMLRAMIGTCDAIICLIGWRYGEAPANRRPVAMPHPAAERHTVCWSSHYT